MLSMYFSNVIYFFSFCQSVGKKQLFWFFTHVTSIFIGVRECFAFQRWLCVSAKTKCAVCVVGFLYVAQRSSVVSYKRSSGIDALTFRFISDFKFIKLLSG